MENGRSHELFLDTTVDGTIDFTAFSVLRKVADGAGKAAINAKGRNLPRVPVAGSKGWLPSMVDVGRQEAVFRDTTNETTNGGDCHASDAFFAVDLECVLHKYRRWHECFPRVKPFYAVKCNPNSAVVRVLAMNSGCGFDCASPAEMDQVLECGVDPSRVIYANPCKDIAALEHALSAGVVTMTFDSEDELYKIRRSLNARAKVLTSSKVDVQLLLRLRVPDAHSDCPLGEKYGAAEDVCGQLIALAVELRLALVGVSFHCGSGCQDAHAYPAALAVAKVVFDIAAQQGVNLTLLDIGGGFPGWDGSECVYEPTSPPGTVGGSLSETNAMQAAGGVINGGKSIAPPPPLSLAEIAQVTLPVLDELFPPSSGVQVIAEPGRYFVEASHILFARIYAERTLDIQASDGITGTNSADGDGTDGDSRGGRRRIKAYFIDEGVHGCFKDKVLCGVNFEPCPVSLGHLPKEAELLCANMNDGDVPVPTAERKEPDGLATAGAEEEEEDAVVMGPSGFATDVVARKRLPKSLRPGDWLYFSRMGAYTASIATVASSAVLEASFCYVASSPVEKKESLSM